ncbi:3-oxoadipate enol-lactonase [Phaeobacter gallaeciensis]|uniref:3-oxoadipate enol-lactonase n=1 Tax=Phaeobacter gallaeciensis TaxID=60890 RepID=A0AAC9ZCQ1_9RHOB|nr:3-oxoadipate enol-lactonase [Phaeobacter gallaeciensis]AHD10772.1 3-oxoadipate enol-lactonase [Phaeobacter gallaeciensis DSM 26640]ATE94035.1 putative 3-oxoadipate enol-lactonase [Phaeobacter gallaeciensis]ATE96144.1 putative 3-oxoadipate enol-lactonase [Phaeobacter gallaeciensis]ATF02699.1 putative 3-oxoadipate enol-lactonase [Phaeobacter gallaeciensis]ATF07079.1 putative 3-oxoadipate enol-lactonase [Phaeobacter gallaeciensis]
MPFADLGDIQLHYQLDGTADGPPLVFANSLGTDLRVWDQVVERLPRELRIIRYDLRGHGGTPATPAPYSMGTLVRDAERLFDHLQIKGCIFVGLSIGGMIAQGLAIKRLDLMRGLVLSNTAAKIGTAATWQQRIDAIKRDGIDAIADNIMERWFAPAFRKSPEMAPWRDHLLQQSSEGYIGCCAAIAGTDFYTPTSGLRLPTLGIAGSDDGATPADLVRETVDLIPGSKFELIRRAGHIPCVEQPEAFADRLITFLREQGHI